MIGRLAVPLASLLAMLAATPPASAGEASRSEVATSRPAAQGRASAPRAPRATRSNASVGRSAGRAATSASSARASSPPAVAVRAAPRLAPGLGAVSSAPRTAATRLAGAPPPRAPAPRDWRAAPPIVEIEQRSDIYAISDVHGHYDELVTLLRTNGLVGEGATPTSVPWTGGKAVLVINGDIIDKGGRAVDVIDLARSLQKRADAAGGRVIVTMGNHEAEFFSNPSNRKTTRTDPERLGFRRELSERGIDGDAVAGGRDREGRGRWLRNLPFAARVGKWFFAHGGNTGAATLPALSKKLERGYDRAGFASRTITGAGSILEARQWFGRPNKDHVAADYADKLGVDHIVMGHDSAAFGSWKRIAATKDGALVKIDTGIDEGKRGHLLHIDASGQHVESLSAKGNVQDVR